LASILQYCAGAPQLAFDAGAVLLTEVRKTDRLYVLIDGVIEILRHGIQVALVNALAVAVWGTSSSTALQGAPTRWRTPKAFFDRALTRRYFWPSYSLSD